MIGSKNLLSLSLSIITFAFISVEFLNAADQDAVANKTSQLEKVTYCRPNNMVSALAYIADVKGFFKEEGLEVEFSATTNAKICQDLLVAGKADLMNGAEAPFTYLAASNPDLSIIAFLERNPETSIFARKDRGITSFADIKGKRLASLPGTVSYFFLARVMEQLGITKSELSITSMQPPTMPQALVGGAVDAIVMWEPWGSNAMKQLGENGVRLTNTALYEYEAILLTTNTLKKTRPQVIKKILAALIKAENFIHSNQVESILILSKAIAFEQEVLEKLWPSYTHKVRLENGPLELMQANFRYLQRDDENYKDSPLPDFRSFVDESFLKSVAPERVKW